MVLIADNKDCIEVEGREKINVAVTTASLEIKVSEMSK